MLENIKKYNKKKGSIGENLVEAHLIANNCKIIAKNFQCNAGEIDIIFEDKDEIVFAEIKSRTSIEYGFPAESVTLYKKKHILSTTKYFLYINKIVDCNVRFDVIEVYFKIGKEVSINHIKNVFW